MAVHPCHGVGRVLRDHTHLVLASRRSSPVQILSKTAHLRFKNSTKDADELDVGGHSPARRGEVDKGFLRSAEKVAHLVGGSMEEVVDDVNIECSAFIFGICHVFFHLSLSPDVVHTASKTKPFYILHCLYSTVFDSCTVPVYALRP